MEQDSSENSDEDALSLHSHDVDEFLEIDNRYKGRKSKGENAKRYLVYPDDFARICWDTFITT